MLIGQGYNNPTSCLLFADLQPVLQSKNVDVYRLNQYLVLSNSTVHILINLFLYLHPSLIKSCIRGSSLTQKHFTVKVMLGYNDFFGLNDEEYKAKLQEKSTEDLQKLLVIKIRIIFSSAFTIGTSIALVAFTYGGTLILTGIGTRRLIVADKKLSMIQDELDSRNVPFHELKWKDVTIPFGAALLGTFVAHGVHEVISSIQIQGTTTNGDSGTRVVVDKLVRNAAIKAFDQGTPGAVDTVTSGGTQFVLERTEKWSNRMPFKGPSCIRLFCVNAPECTFCEMIIERGSYHRPS